jgi:Glutamine amidotransferase domain
MCGIVGVAGDLTLKDREIFEDMLDVCQLRGRDSTGVIKVNRQGSQYKWAKRVGPPAYLLDSREYDKSIREVGVSALVGHCRAKTVGDVNVKNAHPFDIEEHGIIGVHNGTLRNYHSLPGHVQGQSDSNTLYETLAQVGPEETFGRVDGAFACVWWDQNTGRLNFIRNKERPLWFTYSKDKRKMYWASEPWMFGAVYRKEDLWDGDGGKVYISLEEDTLYSIEIDANAAKNKPVFKIAEGKKIEKKRFTRPVGFAHGPGGNSSTTTTRTPTSTTCSSTTGSAATGGEVANPFQDDDIPQHLKIPAKPLVKVTKSGTTPTSKDDSSTISKGSVVPLKLSMNTTLSLKSTNSQLALSLPDSPKTSKNVFFDGCDENQLGGLNAQIDRGNIYAPDIGVDTRYIRKLDTEYITDLRTGREVDETTFRKETGGQCCHCDSKIVSVLDVAEIFNNGKRFICKSCVTPRADPILEAIKELA